MNRILSRETLLAYPNFNKPFEISTDASHLQLRAVISQNGKPIAFYSRKLNSAQTRYTTTERELLLIVETLKVADALSRLELKSSNKKKLRSTSDDDNLPQDAFPLQYKSIAAQQHKNTTLLNR